VSSPYPCSSSTDTSYGAAYFVSGLKPLFESQSCASLKAGIIYLPPSLRAVILRKGNTGDLPGSCTTHPAFALLSDPGQALHPDYFRFQVLSPQLQPRRPKALVHLSRLIHTAFAITVYASHCGHPHTQDSLPAASHALPGGIIYPQGCSREFQISLSSLLSRLVLAPCNL
jgi:hypothetical protein